MIRARRRLLAEANLTLFIAAGFCAFPAGRLSALSDQASSPRCGGKTPLRISVQDKRGAEIAGTDERTSLAAFAFLDFEHTYQPGDHIMIHGTWRMAVQLDQNFSECLLYLPDYSSGQFDYEIPNGRAEQQTGSAYAPESFSGVSHRATVRVLSRNERQGYRNLALNPCDVVLPENDPAQAYPHSSTNSYARNLYDFAARNAIDGVEQNGHHGVWPYQSWGPEKRPDLWWKLDFGRPVELDKIRLMIRADFPHDSYWKSAVVEFSDGSQLPLQISSSAKLQEFRFAKRQVSWFRITRLVPEDPAKWCSLIEVEAWGRDLPLCPDVE